MIQVISLLCKKILPNGDPLSSIQDQCWEVECMAFAGYCQEKGQGLDQCFELFKKGLLTEQDEASSRPTFVS